MTQARSLTSESAISQFGGAMLIGGTAFTPVAVQTSCDPSYPDFWIPPMWEVGDLDSADVAGAWFTVIPPGGHGFDADYDVYGCESN
jgi:hypothetical protein